MKLALLTCRNTKHNCAGAADCMHMFHARTGEFSRYGPHDQVCAAAVCDYCINGHQTLDNYLKAWQNEKNSITHVHLCACTSICPCRNYQAIKDYFLQAGMTIGEFSEQDCPLSSKQS